jgi:hypothetical protein
MSCIIGTPRTARLANRRARQANALARSTPPPSRRQRGPADDDTGGCYVEYALADGVVAIRWDGGDMEPQLACMLTSRWTALKGSWDQLRRIWLSQGYRLVPTAADACDLR